METITAPSTDAPRIENGPARTLAGLPMTKATIVYGKTTTSRMGTIGHLTTSLGVLSLNSFMVITIIREQVEYRQSGKGEDFPPAFP